MGDSDFVFNELSPEFLKKLAEFNAWNVAGFDNLANWIEGKRLTGFTIVDRYLPECKSRGECLVLAECCYEYLKEINIQDAKRYKAFFIWESKGRRKNNHWDVQVEEYLDGCNRIMSFCDQLKDKAQNCFYNNVLLKFLDRRKTEHRLAHRRCSVKPVEIDRRISDRRSGRDRRVYDHRNRAAKFFE